MLNYCGSINKYTKDGLILPAAAAIAHLPVTPPLVPDPFGRRLATRRAIRRRASAADDSLPSSDQQQQRVGSASSVHQSASSSFNPTPYVPSPLSTQWASPSISAPYSPAASPIPTFGSSPFFEFRASPSSSIFCPPNGTNTASPVATSRAQMSPNIITSPLLTTPVMTDSPVFSSPVFAADTEAFEPTSSVRTPAADAHGTSFATNAGDLMPNSGFYTMQAVMSALLAVALFFAFLWAWLAWLAKRRQPKQLPYISGPMPYLEYKQPEEPDDDIESRYGTARNTTRSSEVPTLPESVLPTRLWRNSNASVSGGISEFRKSVEEGLDSVGAGRPASLPTKQRTSSASLQSRKMPRGAHTHQHHRSQTMDYRSSRFSMSPEMIILPLTPPASYSSFDRNAIAGRQTSIIAATEPLLLNKPGGRQNAQLPHLAKTAPLADEVSRTIVELQDTRPVSPTESVRSKSSVKSSKSMKQALWALRKTAIIASATSSAKNEPKALEISLPIGRPTETVTDRATSDQQGADVDLSDSVNIVMFDADAVACEDGNADRSELSRSRPVSQQDTLTKTKLRKRSSSLGATKPRPATIGYRYTPPAILVTDHPQALVPPPCPQIKRNSTPSLTDTFPYTISASPSLKSNRISQDRDDVFLLDPARERPESEMTTAISVSHRPDASRHDSVQSTGSMMSASNKSVASIDLATDEEQAFRSQRRRTLLYSVYKQSHSRPDDLAKGITEFENIAEQTTPVETPKRGQKARVILQSNMPAFPQSPLTPPYTPVESRFPKGGITSAAQTPTNRGRSVSAGGAVKPVLDAALTRFSRLDLASEFSMSHFESQTSLRSTSKTDDSRANLPASQGSHNLAGASASPPIPPRSACRRSAQMDTDASRLGKEAHTPAPAPHSGPRRTRSSTVGDKPLSVLTSEAVVRGCAVPLPVITKATRVSVAAAVHSPTSIPSVRSFPQDLRASVSFPSALEKLDTRASSFRTSYSSFGTSDYRRSSIIDMATYASEFPQFNPNPPNLNLRVSNGSLSLPNDEDDDRSVCTSDAF